MVIDSYTSDCIAPRKKCGRLPVVQASKMSKCLSSLNASASPFPRGLVVSLILAINHWMEKVHNARVASDLALFSVLMDTS